MFKILFHVVILFIVVHCNFQKKMSAFITFQIKRCREKINKIKSFINLVIRNQTILIEVYIFDMKVNHYNKIFNH